MTGMGLGIGDVNGDTLWDFVMPEWNGIHLRESNELGFWVETAYAKGVYNDVEAGQKVGWGADMVDLDNDRDLDIAVAFGDLETPAYVAPDEEPDALFLQDDEGHYTDQAGAWGAADLGDGRGVVFIDINNDGWLDQVKRDLSGPTVLYRSNCGTAGWVRIRLHDAAPNTFAVGARVRVWSAGSSQVRAVMAGGHGHASGGPPEVHFGLGTATAIDRVEILWPDGEISNIWDLSPNQVLDITRQ